MNLRKTFLLVVLGSLVLAAMVGMWAILFDVRSERWLLSMLSTAMFSLLALGAAYAIDKRVWVRVMQGTVLLCIFGAGLFLYGIWGRGIWYESEWLGDSMGLTITWAGGLTAAGLLAITRFAGFLTAVRAGAISCIFLLAVMLSMSILIEPRDDMWYRWMGAVSIAAGLGIVAVPILHKVKGIKSPAEIVSAALEMSITCPRCLLAQTIESGESRCTRCRLKFILEIEEPRCPECNYLLYRLTSPRCPECGHALAPGDVEAAAAEV